MLIMVGDMIGIIFSGTNGNRGSLMQCPGLHLTSMWQRTHRRDGYAPLSDSCPRGSKARRSHRLLGI